MKYGRGGVANQLVSTLHPLSTGEVLLKANLNM